MLLKRRQERSSQSFVFALPVTVASKLRVATVETEHGRSGLFETLAALGIHPFGTAYASVQTQLLPAPSGLEPGAAPRADAAEGLIAVSDTSPPRARPRFGAGPETEPLRPLGNVGLGSGRGTDYSATIDGSRWRSAISPMHGESPPQSHVARRGSEGQPHMRLGLVQWEESRAARALKPTNPGRPGVQGNSPCPAPSPPGNDDQLGTGAPPTSSR